jgi:hypothetical protein
MFASMMSRSTSRAGVSTAVLGAPINDDAAIGILPDLERSYAGLVKLG